MPAPGAEDEIHLVVVASPGTLDDLHELHAHMGQVLPPFMVPRFYARVSALPKTVNGKVRKVDPRSMETTADTLDTGGGSARRS